MSSSTDMQHVSQSFAVHACVCCNHWLIPSAGARSFLMELTLSYCDQHKSDFRLTLTIACPRFFGRPQTAPCGISGSSMARSEAPNPLPNFVLLMVMSTFCRFALNQNKNCGIRNGKFCLVVSKKYMNGETTNTFIGCPVSFRGC